MKLKTFFGTDMPALMDQIRAELGEQVLIVSTHRLPDGGLKIITATDTEIETPATPENDFSIDFLLQQHVPTSIARQMSGRTNADTPPAFLADVFTFQPLTGTDKSTRAFCLTGPHGSGKTTAAIKLALNAKLAGLSPCLLTADVVKAGAREQMISFCKIADIPFIPVPQLTDLNHILTTARQTHSFIILDTMGVHYRSESDMRFLKQLKQTARGLEMLLTLPAGLDVTESVDIAASFCRLGADRLIATKLDASAYKGNLLCAAFLNQLPFAAFGTSADISEPFETPSAAKLATLLGEKK